MSQNSTPPTMRDVAAEAGVSRQLVSLVLRGVAGPSEASRRKVLDAAERLGYRPNASARLLRQSRTRLIGVVFSMRSPFQVRVVERLMVRAAERGYAIVLGPLADGRSSGAVVGQLLGERVEAIAAFNPEVAFDAPVPVTWLGEWTDDPGVDNIHVDERAGLGLAIEHLAGLGHRDIAYLGANATRLGRDRARAYREAMSAAGLGGSAREIEAAFGEEPGAEAARALLGGEMPTAIVCAGDTIAVGALAALRAAGVDVPGEVSIVGFDDSYVSALSYTRLTTVHQDVDATVDAILDTVIARIEDPVGPRVVVATPATLVVRETTTGPRGSG